MSINIRIESNLNNVSDELQRAIEASLEAIGLYVESEAKVRTPVDTGNLRSSITHEVDVQSKKVDVGTNVEYAPFVELGTRHQTAQPFLTPAVEENISNIEQIAKQTFERFGR